jgi:hypothetical protein
MKKMYSFSVFLAIPFMVNFCSEPEPEQQQFLTEAVPTYIQVINSCGEPAANKEVFYFRSERGDCSFEREPQGDMEVTDDNGRAVIYIPSGVLYKIQIDAGWSKDIKCIKATTAPQTVILGIDC